MLLLTQLLPLVEYNGLIPSHLDFRQTHSTTDQTHRIIHRLNEAVEHKAYCSTAFLDISQAFDKVWHISLLYKLRPSLPINYFLLLLQSFLLNWHFFVRFGTAQHPLSPIHDGVPQSSVLGPFLYLIYTADLPTSPATTTATFADDTAILTSDSDPATALLKLQNHLNAIKTCLHKWCKQANTLKSVHVMFTTCTGMCSPVHMNNVQLPCADQVKYLGIHLDRKLTWHHHIFTKRKQLGHTLTDMYWLL
jgi:hypothetical protein